MKAKFLKMAGVKTEKAFYKKFPTEKAFMARYGKKFKKAQMGTSFGPALADAASNLQNQQSGIGKRAEEQLQGFLQNDPVGQIRDTVQGFKAQKERVAQANQNKQVMGWFEDATMSNRRGELKDVEDERLKAYVRPEDNVITGEELFPTYGVGTNVLARYGKKIKPPKAQNGFLGMSGNQWGAIGKQGLDTGLQWAGNKYGIGDDMGSQVGGKIGEIGGNILGGPIGGMIGKFGGQAIGDALDRSDTKIDRYNTQADRSLQNMIGMNVGSSMHKKFGANMKDGGTMKYADGGNIQMLGDGSLTPISNNPNSGEMSMINGADHVNGGEDMVVNGQQVEAEKGEPIYETTEGDTAIAGARIVPISIKKSAETFTGEKFSGKQFKHVLTSVGEAENKQNKITERSVEQAEKYTPLRSLDRISLNTLDTNMKIADDKLKKLQIIKDGFADVQETLNGEEANARYGKKIKKKAQDGTIFKTEKEATDAGYEKQPDGRWRIQTQEGEDWGEIDVTTTAEGTPAKPGIPGDVISNSGPKMSNEAWKDFLKKETYDQKLKRHEREVKQGVRSVGTPGTKAIPGKETTITEDLGGIDDIFEYASIAPGETTPEEKKEGFDWWNNITQGFKASDAEDFDSRQLLPEAWAMANNKLEAVQSQKYQPRLRVPYDISFQDKLNLNTAKARSAERLAAYNPGMLANLKAQEYTADQNVLGDQFRQNQQFKDQIYSGNLATLNDADLKNLAIADTQYTRQEQAKSITKATDFESIKSMTDKRMKQALENKTLRVWENMYDYRYDPAGKAKYEGQPINPDDMWAVAGTNTQNTPEGMVITGYDKRRRPRYGYPSDASEQRRRNAGGTPGIIARNGYLVKSYKKFK